MGSSIWRIDKPEQFLHQIHWTCDETEGPLASLCWIWPGKDDFRPDLKINGKKMAISRWILWFLTGELQECARHKCDIGRCCNPDHLEWGTFQQNTQDMFERKREGKANHKGESNGGRKLTEDNVREMRHLHATGATAADLSRKYNISWHTANNAMRGITWKHI